MLIVILLHSIPYFSDLSTVDMKSKIRIPEDIDVFRVSEFNCAVEKEDSKAPNIIDICFVKDNNILVLDQDNMCLKLYSFFGQFEESIRLKCPPKRMTRIDDDSVAVTYKNRVVIDVLDLRRSTAPIETLDFTSAVGTDDQIRGVAALSRSCIFFGTVKYPAKIYIWKSGTVIKLLEKDFNGALLNSVKRMACPFTTSTGSEAENVVIGDQNSKCLLCLDKKGKISFMQEKHNKGLYNLRGVAAIGDHVYVAANRGINRFSFKDQFKTYTTIVEFREDVYHMRGVAIDKTGTFLAVSNAYRDTDGIRVFRIDNSNKVLQKIIRKSKSTELYPCKSKFTQAGRMLICTIFTLYKLIYGMDY